MHFVVAHKRALQTHGLGAAGLEEEEVAVFEQVFRAHLVEDGAAVDAALHSEGHAGGDVGLNQAGYHVHAGALGGHNQVHAGGAGFLRQAGDLRFHRLFLGHHQVGQFINHNHDIGQLLQRLGLVGIGAEGIGQGLAGSGGFGHFLVEAGQVAYAGMGEQAVAFFHFGHAPIQRLPGLAHIGYHRAEQVRNAFIYGKLQHFRVDHDKAHLVRRGLVQYRHNHGVHAHRFARAGHAAHQKVWHFAQIGHHRLPGNIFAQGHGKLGRRGGKHRRRQNFAQQHFLPLLVRHFDAHGALARNGFHHAHRLHGKRARQIFGQIGNLAAFHALRRLDFKTRDHRPGGGAHHGNLNAEFGQLGLDALGHVLQGFGVDFRFVLLRAREQIQFRQQVSAVFGLLFGSEQIFLPLGRGFLFFR